MELFPDKIFFDGNELTGIIDFYLSCFDNFIYDLSIVVNAWCFPNNKFKIEEADIVLVGDSLITGTSNSQKNIPANILSDLTGLKVYTLSVIGGPQHYEHYLEEMIEKINEKAKIFVFYSEGTDFEINYINPDLNS